MMLMGHEAKDGEYDEASQKTGASVDAGEDNTVPVRIG